MIILSHVIYMVEVQPYRIYMMNHPYRVRNCFATIAGKWSLGKSNRLNKESRLSPTVPRAPIQTPVTS